MSDDVIHFVRVLKDMLSEADRAALDTALKSDNPINVTFWNAILKSHVMCLDPVMFISKGDRKLISTQAFDAAYNRISNELPKTIMPTKYRDRASLFAKSRFDLLQSTGACYRPGEGDWIGTKFNMWRDPHIVPLAELPSIFIEHVNYLIPDGHERDLFLNWLAWKIQRPSEKMMFAALLIGRGGTGKSWFSKLMEIIFGIDNVLVFEKGERIADKFNAEHANKQMVVIDELVPDGRNNLVAAVAPMITQPMCWVERKGIDKFKVPNLFDVLAISNFPLALKIPRDDRRWAVIRTTQDIFGADEKGIPTDVTRDYYNRLHGVTPDDGTVTDEVRRIVWWLGERDLFGFDGKLPAPMTDAKEEVAELGESNIESQVLDLARRQRGPFKYALMTVADVRRAIAISMSFADSKQANQITAEVVAAMEVAGARRLSSKHSYINSGRGRIWAATPALAKEFKDAGPAILAKHYRFERELDPPDGADTTDFDEAAE